MKNAKFRILAPVEPDGSIEDLTRLLKAVFPPDGTTVRCFFVARPIGTEVFLPEMYSAYSEIESIDREARLAAQEQLRLLAAPLRAQGYAVESDVVEGLPIAEVIREMSAWEANITVIRASRKGPDGHRIGQLTSALLRHGTTPLLIHRDVPEGFRVRRVLIATDFSDASKGSADWGLGVAALAGAEAHLLHVLARHGTRRIDPATLLRAGSEEIARWRTQIDPSFGVPVTDAHVVSAEFPPAGILNFAREEAFDLIALAGTVRSVVSTALLGSNARTVDQESDRPVLLIPVRNRVTPRALSGKTSVEIAVPA